MTDNAGAVMLLLMYLVSLNMPTPLRRTKRKP